MNYRNFGKLIILFNGMAIFAMQSVNLAANPSAATQPTTQMSRGTILLGTVCDDDGASPIVGESLMVIQAKKGGERGEIISTARTNGVGAFSFDQYIPEGNYEVLVSARQGRFIASKVLSITKKSEPVVLLQMQTFTGKLEGTLVQMSGERAVGAKIVLVRNDQLFTVSAETDKDGRYKAGHIAFGIYHVAATYMGKGGLQTATADVEIGNDLVKKDLTLIGIPKALDPKNAGSALAGNWLVRCHSSKLGWLGIGYATSARK